MGPDSMIEVKITIDSICKSSTCTFSTKKKKNADRLAQAAPWCVSNPKQGYINHESVQSIQVWPRNNPITSVP